MATLLIILLSAVLTSIVVLAHVPQWRPFVGIAAVFEGAVALAIAVLLALPLTAALAYLLSRGVLVPQRIEYLRTPVFFAVAILVTALTEAFMHRIVRRAPARPGFPLLVMTNCALPGIAFAADERGRGFWDAVLVAGVSGAAFGGLLLAFAALHERLRYADVPHVFRDAPLALVTAGIIALACIGFTGLVQQ